MLRIWGEEDIRHLIYEWSVKMQENINNTSPIMVLKRCIKKYFRRPIILDYVRNGDLDDDIIFDGVNKLYDEIKERARVPRAICKKGQVEVNIRFLEFMWTFTYSHWVRFEEGVMKKVDNDNINMEVIKRANLLRHWAKSLSEKDHDWYILLPNPREYILDEERYYGEKVNRIFVDAICIMLWHEASHIINKHCEEKIKIEKKTYGTRTREDDEFLHNCEIEADTFALETLMNGETDPTERFLKGISVLMAFISPLFLIEYPEMIKQRLGLDLDNRLVNMLEFIGITERKWEDYLYQFGCAILEDYVDIINKLFPDLNIFHPTPPYITPKDTFLKYIDKIGVLKNGTWW
jgi:hypothetical protein